MAKRTLQGEHMLTDAGRAEWGSRNARASALASSPYKRDFPLLATRPDLAFLDSAATAQRPTSVLDAQRRFLHAERFLQIGERLLIKPSWEPVPAGNTRTILEIDPASSFGTGQHHTTRLCLELAEGVLNDGDRVLDLGCGSGILSIGTILLGAKEATAVDIVDNSVRTAVENAEKNGISADRYTAYCGDIISDEALRTKLGTGYDLICANIVADVLIAMSGLFGGFLKEHGYLIVSGIITERADEVLDVLRSAGFTLLKKH